MWSAAAALAAANVELQRQCDVLTTRNTALELALATRAGRTHAT